MGLRGIALLGALLAGVASAADDPPADAVLCEAAFLEQSDPGRIYVDLSPPTGRSLPLLVDTGATHSVITPRLARSLGIAVRRTRFDPYRRPTRLGRDLLFFVDDSVSDTAGAFGLEYGLLGGNFLSAYVVEIDTKHQRLRLLDPERYEVPEVATDPDAVSLPLQVISNRPSVEMEVSGRRMLVLLDTGAPPGLMLGGDLADRAEVMRRPDLPSRFVTVWGEIDSVLGTAQSLAIGPFQLAPVPVIVLPNGWFNFGLAKDATVGMDVLAQFLVRIDYPRQRLWLRRRDDWQVAWDAEKWSGWPGPGEAAVRLVQQGGGTPPSSPGRRATADVDPELLAPAREAKPVTRKVWLDLAVPAEDETFLGRAGWAEVRGWAGSGSATRHDVMVVVDVSGSTAYASGVDVDGDGKLGKARRRVDQWRTFNPRHYSSDPGDTVLAAELLATRRLIELLDPVRTRVGLVSFADGATLLAPVGSDGEALDEGLAVLEENFGSGYTNLSAALDLSRKALVAAGGKGREKAILVLSDGYPTAPGNPKLAAEEAWQRAEEARAHGIHIYSFGLGLGEAGEGDVYAAIAEHTGGRYERLDRPGEIVQELPRIDLARVASLDVRNVTTGAAGRALRVFPDGSFDAFVRLAPGENRLRVTARGDDGGERSVERRVSYDAREPASPEEARAFAAEEERLKEALARRSIEVELTAEAKRRAAGQERQLELDVEEPAPDADAK